MHAFNCAERGAGTRSFGGSIFLRPWDAEFLIWTDRGTVFDVVHHCEGRMVDFVPLSDGVKCLALLDDVCLLKRS